MNFSKLILTTLLTFSLSSSITEAGRYKYGDTSAKTGRYTTKHVNSYYRADGTFVDSYWRS